MNNDFPWTHCRRVVIADRRDVAERVLSGTVDRSVTDRRGEEWMGIGNNAGSCEPGRTEQRCNDMDEPAMICPDRVMADRFSYETLTTRHGYPFHAPIRTKLIHGYLKFVSTTYVTNRQPRGSRLAWGSSGCSGI